MGMPPVGKDRMTCSGGPLMVGWATNWLFIPVQAYAMEWLVASKANCGVGHHWELSW
jgi:hypothetical protein